MQPASVPIPQVLARADELAALYRLTDELYRAKSPADAYEAALDAITATLGCDRASVLLFDDQGVMQFVAWRGLSDHYRETLRGHSPWKAGDSEPFPIFVSDIDETSEAESVKAAIKNENIRALGFIPLVAQGRVIGKFMSYYEIARTFPDHEVDLAITISRQLGFAIERARAEEARRVAEDDLRESEERFRLMSESAPVMIWMSDASGACLHLNRMLRDFWAVDEAHIPEFDWQRMMHPEDAPEITRQIIDAMTQRKPVTIRGRYVNAEGKYRYLETNARPRFSVKGEFLGMIGVNADISERMEADHQRELLLAELNHRVKNTLAVVQGIAYQTFKDNKASTEARKAFEGRLVALSAAHNLLTQSHWESASVEQLARNALQAAASGERATMTGERVLLPPKVALSIAMALHELSTNAVKYGALSNDVGRVALDWNKSADAEPKLTIRWREQGGPPVMPPARRGFGTLLLERTLAQDLDARVTTSFDPAGLVCIIQVPLQSRA